MRAGAASDRPPSRCGSAHALRMAWLLDAVPIERRPPFSTFFEKAQPGARDARAGRRRRMIALSGAASPCPPGHGRDRRHVAYPNRRMLAISARRRFRHDRRAPPLLFRFPQSRLAGVYRGRTLTSDLLRARRRHGAAARPSARLLDVGTPLADLLVNDDLSLVASFGYTISGCSPGCRAVEHGELLRSALLVMHNFSCLVDFDLCVHRARDVERNARQGDLEVRLCRRSGPSASRRSTRTARARGASSASRSRDGEFLVFVGPSGCGKTTRSAHGRGARGRLTGGDDPHRRRAR